MESAADTIQERLVHGIEGPIRCPLCGNESWTSYDDVAVVDTQKAGRWHDPGNSIGAVGAFCNRCGFIRFHAVSSKTFADLQDDPHYVGDAFTVEPLDLGGEVETVEHFASAGREAVHVAHEVPGDLARVV